MKKNEMIVTSLACLKLFKALPQFNAPTSKKVNLLGNGLFITDEAWNTNPVISFLIEDMKKIYGYDLVSLNRSFKNFKQASTDSLEKMFADQIAHYFTTYGLESLGIYREDLIYIPNEVLELPEGASLVHVTIIKSLTNEEISEKVTKLLASGVALKKDTQNDLMTLVENLMIDLKNDIHKVKNKEFKIRLYDYYKTVPKNEMEWLRYVVYKLTGSTNLIKNKATFNVISNSKCDELDRYFKSITLEQLASIFYRFKPLFLAMKKSDKRVASHVNRIRRLAVTYHKPAKEKILDIVTSKDVDLEELKKELEKVTIFKKVSLINAILYRRNLPDNIAYFIRNGKAFVSEYTSDYIVKDEVLSLLMKNVVETVKKNVEGKTVYIPENMTYAVPTSEKLFWNHIPFNSSIQLKKDAVLGVHWENTKDRVDLDLSLVSRSYHISWYNQFNYNNDNLRRSQNIVFSGDMTSAPKPKGATEAYYLGKDVMTDELCMLDLRNYTQNGPVEFKLIIDSPEKDRVDKKYLIDSHTMNYCMNNVIEDNSMFLGFLDIEQEDKKFYFTSSTMGNDIISDYDDNAEKMLSAMKTKFESCLKLNDILKMAGAKFEKNDEDDWDINLDPNQVTKDVFVKLLS